jgi:hypothetical protein
MFLGGLAPGDLNLYGMFIGLFVTVLGGKGYSQAKPAMFQRIPVPPLESRG